MSFTASLILHRWAVDTSLKTFSSSKTLFNSSLAVVFELSITIKFQVTIKKFLVLDFAVKFKLEQNLLRNDDYDNFQSFYSQQKNAKSIHDIPSRCAKSKFHPQKNYIKVMIRMGGKSRLSWMLFAALVEIKFVISKHFHLLRTNWIEI